MNHCSARFSLHQCFQAWRGNLQQAAATGERLQGLAHRLARTSFGIAALDKAIYDGLGRDRADFVRRQTEQARAQGPMEFAHRIRAVLRMGRRYRAPQILRGLRDGAHTAWTHGRHTPFLMNYLEAQLGTTWFTMEAPASAVYISGSGTAPGSPVADLFFHFLYSRFLVHMETALLAEGHCVRLHSSDAKDSVAPTWADDTALLIGPLPPDRLAPTLSRVASLLSCGLSGMGLEANFGPGKSEAVVHIAGPGSAPEKVRLVSERALPRFLYGAGHWTPRNASAYRQSFRPITGISSAGYSNHEVAAVLGLPTAEELLHQARAVAFVDACETGSAAVHAALRKDGTWLRIAWDVPISLCTTDPPNLSGLLETLPGGRAHARRLCKGFLRAQVTNRAPPPVLETRDPAVTEAPQSRLRYTPSCGTSVRLVVLPS
eukprot:s344_g8.t1